MLESLIGLGLVGLLGLVAWAAHAEPDAMVRGGIALASAGFAFGIPTAIVYHWRLHASLRRARRLPRGWWISPTRHHALVPHAERRGVLLWGALGGSGFVVIVLGLILTSAGLWRMLAP